MRRSSETIGTIAAALARAQAHLVNPEKSLTGAIRSDGTGGAERSFRYAPLSSGLDIVRNALSQHEIATVQTTSIDETSGIIRLSTVLAHASGEWIASDWPVCAISDTATPHRMGAALTYARRYALFTLVGIVGEDDLDAPDLLSAAVPETKTDSPTRDKKDRLNGGQDQSGQRFSSGRLPKPASGAAKPVLEPEASAALRDQLAAELKELNSAEQAANWAHRVMASKNTLIEADAALIEQTFQAKLGMFVGDPLDEIRSPQAAEWRPTKRERKRRQSTVIDKGSYTPSRHWTGVNHRNESGVVGFQVEIEYE